MSRLVNPNAHTVRLTPENHRPRTVSRFPGPRSVRFAREKILDHSIEYMTDQTCSAQLSARRVLAFPLMISKLQLPAEPSVQRVVRCLEWADLTRISDRNSEAVQDGRMRCRLDRRRRARQ